MAAIRQLLSQTSYDGDGTTIAWNFNFADGYLDRSHVKASMLIKATGLETQIPLTEANFIGPNQVQITPPIPLGVELTIYRDTPKDAPLVNFRDRASLTETSLDYNARQCVMVAAEASDGLSTAIRSVAVIANLAQSVERFTGQAEAFATSARESAASADQSAIVSATNASYSQNSAINADGSRRAAQDAKDATLLALAQVANGPVLSVAGRQGAISRDQLRVDLAINNVENTADFQKPVSQLQAAALSKRVTHGNSSVDVTWVNGDGLRVKVDSTNFGSLWPISVSGTADSAKYATSAGAASTANYATTSGSSNYAASAGSAGSANTANYAGNAGALGGVGPASYVSNASPGNGLSWAWDGYAMVGRVDGTVQYAWTEWGRVLNRPTQVSQLANDMGYAQKYGAYGMIDVGAPDGAAVVGRAIPAADNRIRYLSVISGGIGTVVDNQAYSWAINPSDAELKTDIRISQEDSLWKIMQMEFKSFKFNDISPMMQGISRKAGLIAQDLEVLDKDFITKFGDYRQLNIETLLTASLQAIQQLAKEVFDLKAQRNEHTSPT